MKIELHPLARSLVKKLQAGLRHWKSTALNLDRQNDALRTENQALKQRAKLLQNITIDRVIREPGQPLEIRWRIDAQVLKYHRVPEDVFKDAMAEMWHQLQALQK